MHVLATQKIQFVNMNMNHNPRESFRKHALKMLAVAVGINALLCPIGLTAATQPRETFAALTEEITSQEETDSHIPIFGERRPLNQTQVDALIARLNEEYDAEHNERKSNTFYLTWVVPESEYKSFPKGTGDPNYLTFAKRHMKAINEIVRDNDPHLSGGVVLRRLIVVADGVEVTPSWHLGWLEHGLHDSNGVIYRWEGKPFTPPPEESVYWDPVLRIARDILHLMGHYILHLPDTYAFNSRFENSGATNLPPQVISLMLGEKEYLKKFIPELSDEKIVQKLQTAITQKEPAVKIAVPAEIGDAFWGIPLEYQEYNLGWRSDGRGNALMDACETKLDKYTRWLLDGRAKQGELHNEKITIPQGAWDFRPETAAENILVVGDKFNGAEVEVWRSSGTYTKREMKNKIFSGQVVNGEVTIGNPFTTAKLTADGLLPAHEAVILIKIIQEDKVSWRFLDVADFSVGMGLDLPYPTGLKLGIQLSDAENPPQAIDSSVKYTPFHALPYKTYLPLASRN